MPSSLSRVYMYVCVRVTECRVCESVCVCVCAFVHIYTHIRMHTYIYIYEYMNIYISIYIYTYIHMYIYICIYIFMCCNVWRLSQGSLSFQETTSFQKTRCWDLWGLLLLQAHTSVIPTFPLCSAIFLRYNLILSIWIIRVPPCYES